MVVAFLCAIGPLVIIHELGHAIHDWVTGENLSQVNGLSEGTGDYFAQSYSRAYGLWPRSCARGLSFAANGVDHDRPMAPLWISLLR